MKKYHILKLSFTFHFFFLSVGLMAYDNYPVQLMTIVKNNETTVNSLSQQMSYLQDRCSSLELQVSQLKQALAAERQNNSKIQSDIVALKQQLGEDKAQIQKSLNMAVDRIANETSKAVSSAVKSSKNTQAATSSTAATGKFYVYKVQEGATLTTIAKAYKVSVESIKKANKLKDHTLSTGQVLYIPKAN
jgi:stage VI sporulation protein D